MQIIKCAKCGEDFIKKTHNQTNCQKKECKSRAKERKPLRQIGAKMKKRIKEHGSEWDFFIKEVWEKRPHICKITGDPIKGEPRPEYFSHNLSKGRYPDHRYNPKNITLVGSIDAHKENDRRNKGRDLELLLKITS